VVKAEQISSPEPEKASAIPAKPAGKSTKEVKPRTQVKTAPTATASKSTTEMQPQNREKMAPAPGDKGAEK
jgi:hypothetical protein